MAYVPSNPDDDEEQRRQASSNAPGSFGDTTPTSTPTKTNFVNVSDYLDKNPNASEHLGDLASSKLTGQRDETIGALNEAKSNFGQQVQAGGTKLDQSVLDSAFSSPETFTQDPANTAKFLALRDAAYKGPQSLEQTDIFAPTQSKVSALHQMGEGLGTEAGRTKLVEGLSSHPTHGKSSLNQLLLQGNPAAAQKISDTAGTFKSVDDQWQQFMQDAPNQVSQAKSETDATRNATREGLTNATNAFTGQLTNKTNAATNERDAWNLNYTNTLNKLNGSHSGSDLNAKELEALGMKDAFPYLSKLNSFNQDLDRWGNPVNLGSYTSTGRANSEMPTMGNVASAEDYARERALQELSGMDLGLGDTQENPYRANGVMPTVDYMKAFGDAGTRLKGQEADILTHPEGYYPIGEGVPTDDFWSKFYPAKSHYNTTEEAYNAATGFTNTPGYYLPGTQTRTPYDPSANYYTNPTANATPVEGYKFSPPPAGWDANQPPPYPAPTSNPPSGLVNATWNQYTGQWEGARLQPNNPPPTNGGGHIFYSQGVPQ